jgi:hypothetical protein
LLDFAMERDERWRSPNDTSSQGATSLYKPPRTMKPTASASS